MIGFNGGLIGGFRDTTTGTASVPGVWTANEQVVARRRGTWINSDPFFGNVSLLLPGDGTNGSTSIIDRSPSPKTITAFGNAQISTAQSRFGGSSIAFDGNGDYLSITDNDSLDLGTGDFTIETWAYIVSTNEYALYSHAASGGPLLTAYGGAFRFRRFAVADVVVASALPPTNQWVHIAACRSGTSTRLFFNGVQTGSTATDTAGYTVAAPVYVGVDNPNQGPAWLNGYIDDLRITKGVARYTANFTPPAAPLFLF